MNITLRVCSSLIPENIHVEGLICDILINIDDFMFFYKRKKSV